MSDLSRGERIFRGMVGMGAVFGAVGFVAIVSILTFAVISYPGPIERRERYFMGAATAAFFFISFVLGMIYGGVLAFFARGRAFRDLSVLRVGAAGTVVGLIPGAVFLAGALFRNTPGEVATALALFPPIGAAIGVTTLLIARRAKVDAVQGAEISEALPGLRDTRVT